MSLLKKNDKKIMIKSEQHNIEVDWRQLPPQVLEHIYFYIDRSDQVNMSLVCKSWLQEYGCASVWKTFLFDLSKGNPEKEIWPEVKFAERFGCMFRHVEINGDHLSSQVVDKVSFQMQLFFEALLASKCQLRSINFNNLYTICQRMTERVHTNVFQSVLNFMSAQKNLRTVEFRNCCYKNSIGVNLLRIIFESNALNTLVLEGLIRFRDSEMFFFIVSDNENGDSNVILKYRSLLQNLMNLQILKTDYSQIFENTMCSLSDEIELQNPTTKKLSLIELHCNGSKRMRLKGISPVHWCHLQKLCPDVKVRLLLNYSSQIRTHFSFYLVKYIPLVHLEFHLECSDSCEDSCEISVQSLVIVGLFRQICDCKANEHLEYLSITWMHTVENSLTDLIPFLKACQKLKTLKMFLRYPVAGIETLLELWLLRHPVSLETVHISITRVTDEAERYYLMRLALEYERLFRNIGLDLFIESK